MKADWSMFWIWLNGWGLGALSWYWILSFRQSRNRSEGGHKAN